MAQISPVGKGQSRDNNIIEAAGGGLAVGAILGSTVDKMPFVPKEAKFTSVQQLVDAMTGQDKFEINLPSNASTEAKEAKEAFDYIGQRITDMPTKEKVLENAIKTNPILRGRDSVTLEEFAKEYFNNIPEGTNPIEYARSSMDKLTGKCRLYEQIARIPDGKKVAVKGIKRKMKGFKDKNAETLLAETLKSMETGADEKGLLTITPELKAGCENAAKIHNKYYEFLGISTLFKDGKYTKEMATEMVSSNYDSISKDLKDKVESKELKSAFEKLQEHLPKVNNKVKGAIIWGAIGTVAAAAIAHFMSSDKKSA